MPRYTIYFGEDLKNNNSFNNKESFGFCDIKNSKTIGDVKDFITCFNDSLCICMLKLYKVNKGKIYNSYNKFEIKNEDTKKIREIAEDSEVYIAQISNKCTCGFFENNKDLKSFQKKYLVDKINELEKKSEINEFKAENFYDIIIDINSIININKGWNIEMTEEGLKKYNDYKNSELIKIGIVGNINKGKSFILSKLSKISLPTGTSISTKGLSIKYPKLEGGYSNRKFILLDSAGLETPILIDEADETKNQINEDKKVENEENEEKEEKDEKIEKKELGKQNEEKFRLKARDILITESFLQSFIISTSDLLLVVIDKLSFSEQKLINKIKRESRIKNQMKKIFIIHNLKSYRAKSQVEKYINEILLKSATFELRMGENITSDTGKVQTGVYFTEKHQKNLSVFHLLFAADGSEAGEYYNKYTIDFIEGQYNDNLKKENFDVIEKVKTKFSEYSKSYLEQKIEVNDFTSNEENLSNKIIKLKENKKLSLKKCIIDEIGFQTFRKNGVEPQYNYFKNNNTLEFRVELPGNVNPEISGPQFLEENTIITISGEKKKDKIPEDFKSNIFNSRDFGYFNLEIQFKTELFKIKTEIKEKKIKQGLLILSYELDENKKDEKITITPDEEV